MSAPNIRHIPKTTYLTSGTSGVLFAGESGGKQVVLKYERVLRNNNNLVNQWVCFLKMNTLFPSGFPKFYDGCFVNNCNLLNQRMFHGATTQVQQYLKDKLCAISMFERINATGLRAQPERLSEIYKSHYAQLFWAIHCLHSMGYTHNDIFRRNIITQSTTETHIQCGETLIPSFGNRTVLVDFGELSDKNKVNVERDMFRIFNELYIIGGLSDYMNAQKLHIYTNDAKKIRPQPPKNIQSWAQIAWHMTNHPQVGLKTLLGKKYIEGLNEHYNIPKDDILKLCTLETPLECFNYLCKTLPDVKKCKPIKIIPHIKVPLEQVNQCVAHYLQLWSAEPSHFMPIVAVYNDGWVCDKPKFTLSEKSPTPESIKIVINVFEQFKMECPDMTKDNFGTDDKGNLICHGFQKILIGTKGPSQLKKVLSQPRKSVGSTKKSN